MGSVQTQQRSTHTTKKVYSQIQTEMHSYTDLGIISKLVLVTDKGLDQQLVLKCSSSNVLRPSETSEPRIDQTVCK